MEKKYRSKLDEVMDEQGRTSVWLARTVDATEQSVANWRSGSMPSDKYKVRIAKALGATVGHLFFGEGVDQEEHKNSA